jgi:Uma2 family endonuclease
MSRKRREYFCAGVELVWMVDHRNRTITVYRSSERFQIVQEGDSIDGSPVLPGWSFNTADLFAKLDEHPSRG